MELRFGELKWWFQVLSCLKISRTMARVIATNQGIIWGPNYTEAISWLWNGHAVYGFIVIVHLLCACVFIGTVFFEVLIMASIKTKIDAATLKPVEQALSQRLFAFMPWVLLLLVFSGMGLLHTHYHALLPLPHGSFGVLLACKLLLVASVLIHFGTIKYWRHRHVLTARRSRLLHVSVLLHVVFIAVLAKAMFYWTWWM